MPWAPFNIHGDQNLQCHHTVRVVAVHTWDFVVLINITKISHSSRLLGWIVLCQLAQLT